MDKAMSAWCLDSFLGRSCIGWVRRGCGIGVEEVGLAILG